MPPLMWAAVITASGAAIVSLCTMFVNLWVARKQRQSSYASKELDDQYAVERVRREALDEQIIKAELLKVRARDMIRLMELASPKPSKDMQKRLITAQEAFDTACRDFLDSWGRVRTQIESASSPELIKSQQICADAIDAITVSVLLGRRNVSPGEYAYEMRHAGDQLSEAMLQFQAVLLTHKAVKSAALATIERP